MRTLQKDQITTAPTSKRFNQNAHARCNTGFGWQMRLGTGGKDSLRWKISCILWRASPEGWLRSLFTSAPMLVTYLVSFAKWSQTGEVEHVRKLITGMIRWHSQRAHGKKGVNSMRTTTDLEMLLIEKEPIIGIPSR
eukprot:SAG31_NODE_2022_length_6645_cov_15.375191_2_plen_137_part_00